MSSLVGRCLGCALDYRHVADRGRQRTVCAAGIAILLLEAKQKPPIFVAARLVQGSQVWENRNSWRRRCFGVGRRRGAELAAVA